MSDSEFLATRKLLHAALLEYGFLFTFQWVAIAIHREWRVWLYVDTTQTAYPRGQMFAIVDGDRPAYYLKYESSVLKALARIKASRS